MQWGLLVRLFNAAECEEISLVDSGVVLVQGLKQALLEEEGGVGRAIGASPVWGFGCGGVWFGA
jgi:hypothetical protein